MAQSAVDGNSEKFATHVNCEFCDTKKEVKWKCLDCGKIICNECKDKIHKKIRRGKYHEIVEIKEDKQLNFPETDLVNTKCQDHSEQLYSHFCKTCENLVCPSCIVKCNKGHELIEINEMYHSEINRLKKGQSILQNDIAKAATKMHEEKQKQISENSMYCKVNKDINTQENALINAVKEYAQICRMKLNKNHKEISKNIEENIDTISRNINQFEEKYNELEDSITTADVAAFFRSVGRIDRKMYVGKEKTKSTFNFSSNFIPGEISLSHFGEFESNENWFDYLTVDLNINKEYQTELCRVGYLFSCTDSLWIADNKYQILQKVKPEGNTLNILLAFKVNTPIYGIAVTASNNLILATGKSKLLQICGVTGKMTDSIYQYKGDPNISAKSRFKPVAIVTTPKDNVVLADVDTHTIHFLSNSGHLLTYFHTNDIGILYPYSLEFTSSGQLNIGCGRLPGSETKEAMIYKVTISGC
ncbi:unnamed protein product [Mytilus coruscus]|uniref:B box-type domain-containing protein n=1 Tax=Mytilus coruscus TaxID=42192 RepID=A0A6J8EIG0_MYTCO|nr:unnamed protein product [Mytilus coruscus]